MMSTPTSRCGAQDPAQSPRRIARQPSTQLYKQRNAANAASTA
jgi:hypothetical protein